MGKIVRPASVIGAKISLQYQQLKKLLLEYVKF